MNSPVIKPTVGRKVWFRLNGTAELQKPGTSNRGSVAAIDGQPIDATVVYVWNDRLVNLAVLDHYGNSFIATSVTMLQPGEAAPSAGYYAEWMPYQQGQARKDAVSTVLPHQQRVLDEKRDLDERLSKLDAFILDNPLYLQLAADEQERLTRQSKAMAIYSGILGERIAAF